MAETSDVSPTHRKLVDRNRAAIDRIERLLEDDAIPADRVPDASLMLASKHRRIGAVLLDSHRDRARVEMATAARHTLDGIRKKREHLGDTSDHIHWEAEPLDLRDALYAAILAEDEELGRAALESVRRLDATYVERYPQTSAWYYYVTLLAALFEGDVDAQWTALERLRDTVDELATTENNLDTLFSGFLTVFNGLGDRDPDLVRGGLETVHDFHVSATAGKPGSVRRIRDLHTVVLATIADQLGLAN